jgi:acyl-CoA dehydrogenase
MEDLKALAKSEGLWNLFLPHLKDDEPGTQLTNLEYAPLAEIMGRIEWASEAFNCSAPDTGNMELLHMFATPEQYEQWLRPLLNGEIRSAFCMTEPDVASSDATNITTRIQRKGDDYVINGRKWFISNASHPNCKIFILMGKTDPDADTHQQQSMILVPSDTPGVEIVRNPTVLNHHSPAGHSEIVFRNVHVPAANLLGAEGSGFALAQARLGPGRIHHCMRSIGAAELALEMMIERSQERKTFGKYLHQHGTISEWIARSRIEIEQARLLVLKAAWMIDNVGA